MKNIAPILASWSESLPDNVKDAIQAQTKIAQSITEVNEGLQINFSNILADLKRVFESIPTPYSEEENKEIMAGFETMANEGWVIYLDSMLQSYRSENYYAAYTLASLAIDGVITRFSEIQSNASFIPVGRRAVEELDNSVFNKPIVDLGFFKWLYQFFKDTKRFTLDEPNRHMIGHGRWDKELNQVQFLKLFNVMLYLAFRFEIWRHVLGESLSD